MNRVESFLQHYASQYYDPVKAHEYYERTKKLKGRTTSGMSEEQKEAWSYTKDQISTEKKAKIQTEQEAKEAKIEQMRATAAEMRERISEKLKLLSERLSKEAESDREKIEEERQAKIDALPEIPKNISPAKRAKLMEERKKEIADIRNEASEGKSKISDETKTERETGRKGAAIERKQLSTHLKKVITAARDSYKQAREKIDTDYENISQQEYDKILANVPGKKKSSPKGKSSKKASPTPKYTKSTTKSTTKTTTKTVDRSKWTKSSKEDIANEKRKVRL